MLNGLAVVMLVQQVFEMVIATISCAAIFACICLVLLVENYGRYRRLVEVGRQMRAIVDPQSIRRQSQHLTDEVIDLAMQMIGQFGGLHHRSAHCHGVTGFPTREPLLAMMEASQANGVLAMIELCDFDRLGAFDLGAADQVLKEMAGRISRMIAANRFVAHVDRARFAIWYEQMPFAAVSTEIDAICYALRNQISVPGISFLPQIRSAAIEQSSASLPAAMLSRAIASLAGEKHSIQVTPSSDAAVSARERFAFEQDLRQAIEHNQFELWFQPIVNAADRLVCGAEALLRWRHPKRGIVSPGLFIPIAETAGLAQEIGLWTLHHGCREAKAWERSGLSRLKVAVNLSAHQLERTDIDLVVARSLQQHNLDPALLELELTETAAAIDPVTAKRLIDKLRALGVSISIDDFGAGYSSLSYLKKLRFDKLKIDREFITDVEIQRDSQAICQSIIALGRGLGISVLAEGVERAQEYRWLRRHGCTLFQGYYFSRPLEAAAFRSFARNADLIRQLTDLSPRALQEQLSKSA